MVKSASISKYVDQSPISNKNSDLPDSYQQIIHAYQQRIDAFSLMAQINQLIKTVQKHRGYTIGLISGDNSYQERFERLQVALKRRLEVLAVFAITRADLLSNADKSNFHYCWQTIANNWQEDNINETLELHSYFVSQLLLLLNKIAKNVNTPLLDCVEQLDVRDSVKNHMGEYVHSLTRVELQNFVVKFLPENIEQLGKLRALSTHMATLRNNSDADMRKLRFLIETTRQQLGILREMVSRLKDACQGEYQALDGLTKIELQLELLLSQVENALVQNGPTPKPVDSRLLFAKATKVIDEYWLVVGKGLDLLQNWHQQEFDHWLAAP